MATVAEIQAADPGGAVEDAIVNLRAMTDVRIKKVKVTTTLLMSELDITVADDILSALESVSATDSLIRRSIEMLKPSQGGLSIGHSSFQNKIGDLVVAGVLTSDQAAELSGLAIETFYPFSDLTVAHLVKVRAL